ncbi:MAG: histone deacetylase [Chloroflexi bacterium]|nr:histone deacetylase [Chloroflexota bacterium]
MTTGYVYDPLYLEHRASGHPERPERLSSILNALQASGVWDGLVAIPAMDASIEQIAAVHDERYIATVREMASQGGGWLDGDTYLNSRSYDAALRAAGGLLNAVKAVIEGQVDNAFALVRPPGHHAIARRGMGFCLFNNVAIAAKYALSEFDLERILIVDFDVHHGNGTQDAFYDDPHVLYFSTHEYPFYPGTGHWSETGEGAGTGYTVNVPLPAGTGDEGYARIFDEILRPIAARYAPQLILVSAGYDAHWTDPLAMMKLSVSGYARMMQVLVELAEATANGRLVCTLEGGYHLEALAAGVVATCAVMSGLPVTDPLGPSPEAERDVSEAIDTVKQVHGLMS